MKLRLTQAELQHWLDVYGREHFFTDKRQTVTGVKLDCGSMNAPSVELTVQEAEPETLGEKVGDYLAGSSLTD